jgi:hypothetical protein
MGDEADAPRHAAITPAAYCDVMLQLYEAGSLLPAT